MKKTYQILLILFFGILLSVGICSFALYNTNSMAEKPVQFPKFSQKALFSGTYTESLEEYYTKSFPFRADFLNLNKELNRLYYFTVGEKNVLTIAHNGGAEEGGAAPIEQQESETEPVVTPPVQENTPAPAAEEKQIVEEPERNVTALGTIIIDGNRAMEIPTATEELLSRYGEAVEHLASTLPAEVRVFSVLTPNGGQFYSPNSYHTGLHDQAYIINRAYDSMSSRIIKTDVFSALQSHKDEYIFFRTDHHWTQKGAYYAFCAFSREAGFSPLPLESYEYGSYEGFVGSMYNYTSGYAQSEKLKNEPDTLTYYLPKHKTEANYYMDGAMENGCRVPVVDIAFPEGVSNKYMCYLGGDSPICDITSDCDGGTCVIVKESYGNAFIPFLTDYYSRIVAVDPREFNREEKPSLHLAALVQQVKADDVIILDYPFMISNSTYIRLLEALS